MISKFRFWLWLRLRDWFLDCPDVFYDVTRCELVENDILERQDFTVTVNGKMIEYMNVANKKAMQRLRASVNPELKGVVESHFFDLRG